jgi:Zn-dependent peptidase ImmA (M78 family)
MPAALIEPEVLRWALDRARADQADLASAANTSEAIVDSWLDGTKKPTFNQARKIATRLKLPFGFLFLATPPPSTLPIPDFRTLASAVLREPSADLQDVILATLRKQEWMSEYLRRNHGEPVEVVGLGAHRTVTMVASQIRSALKLNASAGRPGSSDAYLRWLVERTEGLGVNVLRNGVVGNNTHRKLNVQEFRGFCLSDDYAPFIFINGADAPNGQIFTLIHEVAHIWRGDTGVSGGPVGIQKGAEAFANEVAAEVLVPSAEFEAFWDGGVEVADALDQASGHFRISRYVIAIRAFESGFIDRDQLDALIEEYESGVRRGSSGGDFYRTLIARNGKSFTSGVIEAVGRQGLLLRDAAGLLDAKPSHLPKVAQTLQQSG